jgi:hypothetical protein
MFTVLHLYGYLLPNGIIMREAIGRMIFLRQPDFGGQHIVAALGIVNITLSALYPPEIRYLVISIQAGDIIPLLAGPVLQAGIEIGRWLIRFK